MTPDNRVTNGLLSRVAALVAKRAANWAFELQCWPERYADDPLPGGVDSFRHDVLQALEQLDSGDGQGASDAPTAETVTPPEARPIPSGTYVSPGGQAAIRGEAVEWNAPEGVHCWRRHVGV